MLPKELAGLFDAVIHDGDFGTLTSLTPQVLAAAARLVKDDPRVGLRALLVARDTSDANERAAENLMSGKLRTDGQVTVAANTADHNLRHESQVNRMLAEIGLTSDLLGLHITNLDLFNGFLNKLSPKVISDPKSFFSLPLEPKVSLYLTGEHRKVLGQIISDQMEIDLGLLKEGTVPKHLVKAFDTVLAASRLDVPVELSNGSKPNRLTVAGLYSAAIKHVKKNVQAKKPAWVASEDIKSSAARCFVEQ